MICVKNIRLEIPHKEEDLKRKVQKYLGMRQEEGFFHFQILKKSLDARKKPILYYNYQVLVGCSREEHFKKTQKNKKNQDILFDYKLPQYQTPKLGKKILKHRPVVVGSGPAGLFAAYLLATLGYAPVVLERGKSVEERKKIVENFWNTGVLHPECNVQFGEGGAGTFSDGKLNTSIKDPKSRGKKVLETFVQHGGPEEILYQNKPHIGTDVLHYVVKNMREEILRMGGEFHFSTKFVDFSLDNKGKLKEIQGINVENRTITTFPTEVLVLAIGHSARDTFRLLEQKQVALSPKSFAIGFRMEHLQSFLDRIQYGSVKDYLPAAEYKVTAQTSFERGVYSFCMCPGGYVVNASSTKGQLAINGMSYHKRDGKNGNSAIIVTVSPEDFPKEGPLSGVYFQESLEKKAYQLCEGKIPVQRWEDFCNNQKSEGPGEILPEIKGEYQWSNLRTLLPEEINLALEEGVQAFDKKLKGFGNPDALLSGIESRTTSPVRIERDVESLQNQEGIYPCGEGAGYAGGITSAAIDGLKVAEKIIEEWAPFS